ncbi:MAG: maltotransferase domain-containing protein [Thermoplasmatota archaeon]
MGRKILVIAVVISLACLVPPGAAATETGVAVEAPAYGNIGDTFTVNVTVEPGEALGGMECGIYFNASVLEVQHIDGGNLFEAWWNDGIDVDNANGTVGQLLGFNYQGNETTLPGIFATITFTATSPGSGWIRLVNVTLSDPTGSESLASATSNDTVIVVNDTQPPVIEDTTPPAATPGEDFTFSAEVNDDTAVSRAYVRYWYQGEQPQNVSMDSLGGGVYEKEVALTSPSEDVYYVISAVDVVGNWNHTTTKTVTAGDDTAPSYTWMEQPTEGTTGESVLVQLRVIDDVAVTSYTINVSGATYDMEKDGDYYSYTLAVPSDSTADVTYRCIFADAAGNTNATPEVTVSVTDNDQPDTSITDGPPGSGASPDVSFTWTGSDTVTSTAGLEYSYQLQGYENSWSTWSTSTSTSYTGFPDGSYTFKVRARDSSGNVDGSPDTWTFTVQQTGPTADFEYTPSHPTVGENVFFSGTSTPDGILNYTWQFGDGTIGYGRNTSHGYATAGTFTVTLQVRDSSDRTDSVSQNITVKSRYEFSISDIDFDTSLFGGVDITVSIINDGAETAEDVSCALSIDGNTVETKKMTGLSAGGTATLSFSGDVSPLRSHTIQATVDPEDIFPEGNEDDNALSTKVPINWLLIAVIAAAIIAASIGLIYLVRRWQHQEAGEPRHRWVQVQDGQEIQRCFVCRGKLKVDAAAVQCTCGNIFHRSCAKRVGECPDCGSELDVGSSDSDEE